MTCHCPDLTTEIRSLAAAVNAALDELRAHRQAEQHSIEATILLHRDPRPAVQHVEADAPQ